MKNETEVFQQEVLPFLQRSRQEASPLYVLHHTWNYDLLLGMINSRDMNITRGDPGSLGPAIVTGSGPSLDEVIPHLNKIRKKQKAKIWVGNTQLWALYYQGVLPDYVVKHDPHPRKCPECNHIGHFTDDGGYECMMNGHKMDADDIRLRTQLHREAPDIDIQPIMHPGVEKENLLWPTMQRRGQLFLADTNPQVKVEQGYVGTREQARASEFERAFSAYQDMPACGRRTPEGQAQLQELMQRSFNAPDIFASQDMIQHTAGILYGDVNPLVRNPINHFVPYCPSTTMMAAMLAYYHGHDPIYFAGYDLGLWNNLNRHTEYFHDGTHRDRAPVGKQERISEMGWGVDHVQLGEKYVLMAYLGKRIQGNFVMPGFRCVEIVVDGKPGNLELIPRIGVNELAKGGKRDIPQKTTAAKIRAVVKERSTRG